jgi:uncharacterized protein YndB with AHSA1/START domain
VQVSFRTVDGRPALRIERRLAHPVERVWQAVTEPDELAHWFPTTVEVDLREGGAMRFTFPQGGLDPMTGEVTELDPPRRIAFRWGDEELRFDLAADDGGCRLVLTHVLSRRDAAARDAAGWHVCLDKLEQHLGGAPAEAPGHRPTEEWRAHFEAYERQGLPTGAEVPG